MAEKPVLKVKRKKKRLYDPSSFEMGFLQEHKPFNFVLSPLRKYLVGDIEPIIEDAVRAFIREETRGLRKCLTSQKADIRRLESELATLRKQIRDLPGDTDSLPETEGPNDLPSPALEERHEPPETKASEPEPANDRQVAIAKITLLLQKGLSHRKIAAYLNANAIPTLSGRGKWHRSAVSRIIREEGTGN